VDREFLPRPAPPRGGRGVWNGPPYGTEGGATG